MTEDQMERVWKRFQELMDYSDDDLAKFKANPKFMQMFSTPAFRTHKIVVEVIQSHGCVCQHKVGQRLVLNANGALLRDECPSLMCVGLIYGLMPVTSALYERITAGLDPNGLLFNTIGCNDVGIDCGGYGRVLARIHVEGPEDK